MTVISGVVLIKGGWVAGGGGGGRVLTVLQLEKRHPEVPLYAKQATTPVTNHNRR